MSVLFGTRWQSQFGYVQKLYQCHIFDKIRMSVIAEDIAEDIVFEEDFIEDAENLEDINPHQFDSRWYTKYPTKPFDISVAEMTSKVLSTSRDDVQRLTLINPDYSNKLQLWFQKNNPKSKVRRQEHVLADPYLMVELSECWVEKSSLKSEHQKFVKVVHIGVTHQYQRIGLSSALLDFLKWLTQTHGYQSMMIEAVINPGFHEALMKRTDCKLVHGNCFSFHLI